eukprot:5479356-Prymnesium_polylepis.1
MRRRRTRPTASCRGWWGAARTAPRASSRRAEVGWRPSAVRPMAVWAVRPLAVRAVRPMAVWAVRPLA